MSNREAAAASERPLPVSQAWNRVRSEAQAVARFHAFDDLYAAVDAYADACVAAASAPQAVRMPLTDDEIREAVRGAGLMFTAPDVQVARAVEKAHGIVSLAPQKERA